MDEGMAGGCSPSFPGPTDPSVIRGQKWSHFRGEARATFWLHSEVNLPLKQAPDTSESLPPMDPMDFTLQLSTQLHGRFKNRQPFHGGVQVQLIPRRPAHEAVVHMAFQVRRERT